MLALGEIMPMSAERASLDTCRQSKRVLLLLAPDAASAPDRRQHAFLPVGEHGLDERDMVVVSVIGRTVATEGEPAAAVPAAELRKAYGVLPHQFRVVLIGKAGGVKLRQEEPISAADLFALIDAMPMRREEIRKLTR